MHNRNRLKAFVSIFYDCQDLRIRSFGRAISADPKTQDGEVKRAPRPHLEPEDVKRVEGWGKKIEGVEHEILKVIVGELEQDPVWTGFLAQIDGIGPALGAVILGGGIDIEKADTPSKLHAYAGLSAGLWCRKCERYRASIEVGNPRYCTCEEPDFVRTDRRVRGQKTKYNPWLRAKLAGVAGDCILKASVRSTVAIDPGGVEPVRAECPGEGWDLREYDWIEEEERTKTVKRKGRKVKVKITVPRARWISRGYVRAYYDYRDRKEHEIVPVCMLCDGTGKALGDDRDRGSEGGGAGGGGAAPKRKVKCWNCDGGTKPAPWGKGDAHRHRAAIRFMVKALLTDLWRFWRQVEGLPVRPSYAEEKLGKAPRGVT